MAPRFQGGGIGERDSDAMMPTRRCLKPTGREAELGGWVLIVGDCGTFAPPNSVGLPAKAIDYMGDRSIIAKGHP